MSLYSRIPRSTRLVATGGLALGVGLGAMVAVNAATSPSPAAATPKPSIGAHLGHGGAPRGGFRGRDGGTITAISGGTLTLRTEPGTETVTTSSSTTYVKEQKSITFDQIHVGDVVHVMPVKGSTPPPSPGTGTVAAGRVVVVVPTLSGRVTDVAGNTVNLVGRDGRLLSVSLTDSTVYRNGMQAADRSAVTAGARIVAEGQQDSLTHLTADAVTVLPAREAGGLGGGFGGRRVGAGAPGSVPPADLPAPPGIGA